MKYIELGWLNWQINQIHLIDTLVQSSAFRSGPCNTFWKHCLNCVDEPSSSNLIISRSQKSKPSQKQKNKASKRISPISISPSPSFAPKAQPGFFFWISIRLVSKAINFLVQIGGLKYKVYVLTVLSEARSKVQKLCFRFASSSLISKATNNQRCPVDYHKAKFSYSIQEF